MDLRRFERFVTKSSLTIDVITFDSGQKFLSYLEQIEKPIKPMPSLVLMDVRMPVLDGFDVVKRVCEAPVFKTLPTIMTFSNPNAESDVRRAREADADSFHVKPSNGEACIEFLNSVV